MFADKELAEYLQGAMKPEARLQFEERLLEDNGAMSELVDQLRTHGALKLLGANRGAKNGPGQKLRMGLIEAIRSKGEESPPQGTKESQGAINAKARDRRLMLAALCLILALLLAICLWHFAPH